MFEATAFFSERKDVSDRTILKQALLDVGLNAEEALKLLDNEEARSERKKATSLLEKFRCKFCTNYCV